MKLTNVWSNKRTRRAFVWVSLNCGLLLSFKSLYSCILVQEMCGQSCKSIFRGPYSTDLKRKYQMILYVKDSSIVPYCSNPRLLYHTFVPTRLINDKKSSWVAQLVERSLPIPEVRGSNPVIGKNLFIYWTFVFCQLCIEKTKI